VDYGDDQTFAPRRTVATELAANHFNVPGGTYGQTLGSSSASFNRPQQLLVQPKASPCSTFNQLVGGAWPITPSCSACLGLVVDLEFPEPGAGAERRTALTSVSIVAWSPPVTAGELPVAPDPHTTESNEPAGLTSRRLRTDTSTATVWLRFQDPGSFGVARCRPGTKLAAAIRVGTSAVVSLLVNALPPANTSLFHPGPPLQTDGRESASSPPSRTAGPIRAPGATAPNGPSPTFGATRNTVGNRHRAVR